MDGTSGGSANARAIARLWTEAARRAVGDSTRVSVLYSGGLDSSLVAWGARPCQEIELVTVGVEGSFDLIAAERGARLLGLPWTRRAVDRSDAERFMRREKTALDAASEASRPVLLGLGLALESARHPRVLCGQGADELFLGYAHFNGLTSSEADGQRRRDLERLLTEDWPLSVALATRCGKDLRSPFLDAEFLTGVRELPIDQVSSGTARKSMLREIARWLGLPPELVERPKKAFQYGSGLAKLLKASGPRRGRA